MITTFPSRVATLSALIALTGCAAVPDTGPQPAPIAPESIIASQSLPGTAEGEWPRMASWRGYADPQLGLLIEEGLANSPDLAAALARTRAAAALVQEARGATLPSLDVGGGASLEKRTYNGGFPKQFVPEGWNDNGEASATLGFDLDLWGRNRAALAAARGEVHAAAVEAQEVRLMVGSSIALAYVDLSRQMAMRDTRQQMLDLQTSRQDLVARRVAQGIDNAAILRSAEAASASVRSDLAAADAMVLLRRHQLAVLMGAGPDRGLAITRPHLPPAAARSLPQDITTNLIGHRPDIIVARERMQAAAARVKVARADFYPAIRLGALIGFQSLGLSHLFESDSVYGSVGPAISLPLFHGGALQGRYRAQQAGFDAAVADYDKNVLTAYQQVAYAWVDRRTAGERLVEAKAAYDAGAAAVELVKRREGAGLASHLDVLAAEERMLQARFVLDEFEAATTSAEMILIRALGGGFADTRATQSEDNPHE